MRSTALIFLAALMCAARDPPRKYDSREEKFTLEVDSLQKKCDQIIDNNKLLRTELDEARKSAATQEWRGKKKIDALEGLVAQLTEENATLRKALEQKTVPELKKEPRKVDLVLERGLEYEYYSNRVVISGTVTNRSGFSLGEARIVLKVIDERDNQLGTATASIKDLEQSWAFRATFFGYKGVGGIKVKVASLTGVPR